VERLRVEIESCWSAVFFNLGKKSRLGVDFGNSWRCYYSIKFCKTTPYFNILVKRRKCPPIV
jgi:hypothetical protein